MGRKTKWENYQDCYDLYVNLDRYKSLLEENQTTGCLEWRGPLHNQGYGFIGAIRKHDNKRLMVTTHRVAARLKLGRELRVGENVVHTCNNPKCCNPDHLMVGNLKLRDKMMKQNGITRKKKTQ